MQISLEMYILVFIQCECNADVPQLRLSSSLYYPPIHSFDVRSHIYTQFKKITKIPVDYHKIFHRQQNQKHHYFLNYFIISLAFCATNLVVCVSVIVQTKCISISFVRSMFNVFYVDDVLQLFYLQQWKLF